MSIHPHVNAFHARFECYSACSQRLSCTDEDEEAGTGKENYAAKHDRKKREKVEFLGWGWQMLLSTS
jgi:hypothetical protein